MAGENVIEITDGNFETQVMDSEMPVLVDFWAEWCQPCRALTPTIEKLAQDYNGRVKVGKVDVDSNRDVAVKYGVNSIPTVIIFKGGDVLNKTVGLKSESDFRSMLDASLA